MRTKTMIALVLVCGLAWLIWPADDSQRDEGATVINRVWLDRIPYKATDKFSVLILVDDPEEFGLFQHTSAYEGDFAIFSWQRKNARQYRVTMLQDGRKHEVEARISDRDCKGFDYCLQVQGAPRGPARYYSMKDWVIEAQGGKAPDMHDMQRRIAAEVDRILAAAEAP